MKKVIRKTEKVVKREVVIFVNSFGKAAKACVRREIEVTDVEIVPCALLGFKRRG